ncbi:hypothetical protein MD484_g923, partial [Candolleomyces efflorescens]
MPATQQRPRTHKPRGICRYYNVPRGCFAGDKCKFLHGEPSQTSTAVEGSSGQAPPPQPTRPLLTPYDQAKRCRYYANGFCKRGEDCWFRHATDDPLSPNGKGKEREDDGGSDSESEHLCSICLENPVTFGLLGGCSHIFCIGCIKQWRDPNSKSIDVVSSGNNKKCPMCRTPSNFITPSSVFVKHGTEEKNIIVEMYRESMARVQCRYFQKSIGKSPMCPFGKDCFYKHEKPDGTLHVFQEGASRYAIRNRPRSNLNNLFMFSDSDTEEIAGGFGLFPFDIGSIPFLELLNPAGIDSESIRGGPARAPGGQATNPRVEVSVGQFDFSWAFDPARRARNDPPTGAQADSEGQDNSGRRANIQQTSRTIQDIGQSLEALTVAMNDGANLDRISQTVQHLQHRLRRDTNETGDSMERLQNLADQMMASIELLQTANVTRLDPSVQREASPPTSPPPLEPISPTTNNSNRSNRRRTSAPVYADDSEDDMPGLQSISNSSEEYPSSDDDDDTDFEEEPLNISREHSPLRGIRFYRRSGLNFVRRREHALGVPRGRSTSATRPTSGPAPSTNRSETAAGAVPPPLIDSQTALPSLEQQSASEGPTRPAESPSAPDAQPALEPSSPNASLVSPPPFVTDGRGRVVWTDSSNQTNEVPASASPRGPPPSTAPAASPPTSPSTSRANAPTGSSSRKANPVVEMNAPASSPAPAATGNGGFTTDGRGRVIATSTTTPAAGSMEASPADNTREEEQPTSPQDRSLLGRVLDAFF